MNILEIIFISFLSAAAIQLGYLWIVFSRVSFIKKQENQVNSFEPITVVIAAKNEYHNLVLHLRDILEQDYPSFEVVVVNDQSTDESEYYLDSIRREYPHLKIVNVNNPVNFFKGKKFPLSIGIKSATHDLLVLTDADCKPSSKTWLTEIAMSYTKETELSLGYGGYQQDKGLLNYIIRFETLITAQKYLSFAKVGLPYMGVGRNLSYRKSLFYNQHGFQSHYKIQSGDDDLFVNKAANSKNTNIFVSPTSKTLSIPHSSLSSWWRQKRRHLTTGKYYKRIHLVMLSLNDLSYVIMIVSGIILLTSKFQTITIITTLVLRYASFLIILKLLMQKVGERKLLVISPLLELILSAVMPIIAMTNILHKRDKWK